MGEIDMLAVLLATLAFFAVGAVWYSALFAKPWMNAAGMTEEQVRSGHGGGRNPTWLIFALTFAFEMLVVLTLAHLVARTNPAPHVVMMMAIGLGATVMVPAIGINYLYQMRPLKLFLIDAGHFVVGMAAAGGVLVAMD